MVKVLNEAGEKIAEFGSDAEAARFFLEQGRYGDRIDTGENLHDVAEDVLGVRVRYDSLGQVDKEGM